MFTKSERKLVTGPLWENNPITVQVLGICSALAVTTLVKPALVMSIALTLVIVFSNLSVSILRNYIPNRIRIIVELSIIATLVILIDQFLKAYMYEQSKILSVFVGLIITNCIVMGRAESFAMGNNPWRAVLDGVGNGLGYGAILIGVAIFREVLGKGTLFGYKVVPQFLYNLGYEDNIMMVLSPAAFFLIGLFIWLQRSISGKLVEKE
ncbi:NADH:ubiquinone reductase (Na(+)-transporting) subunit D [Fibrobacterota bacterium]